MSAIGKWFGFSREEVYEEGVRAFELGSYEVAIEAFEASIESDDPDIARLSRAALGDSYARLGEHQMQNGMPAAAAQSFEQALVFHPNYPDLHLSLARAYAALGDEERRCTEIREALAINPRYMDALVERALLLYDAGEGESAIRALIEDLPPDSVDAIACLEAAMVAHRERCPDQARAWIAQTASLNSNDPKLHALVAASYARAGLWQEASEAYQTAIALRPDYADLHFRLAESLAALGRTTEAAEELREALAINPSLSEADRLLGELASEDRGRRASMF